MNIYVHNKIDMFIIKEHNFMKKDICIDFDGVLNTYTHWQGEDYLFEMKDGCDEFLKKLSQTYNITILTTRKPHLVTKWLEKYNLQTYIKQVTNQKIPAIAYVDDRAIAFNGNYDKLFSDIINFVHYSKIQPK